MPACRVLRTSRPRRVIDVLDVDVPARRLRRRDAGSLARADIDRDPSARSVGSPEQRPDLAAASHCSRGVAEVEAGDAARREVVKHRLDCPPQRWVHNLNYGQ